MTRSILLLIIAFLVTADGTHAQFSALETKDLRVVYYSDLHAYVLPHLTRCFENSIRFHEKLFSYSPWEKITVLLEDFDDYGYAGATSIPFNYLRLGIEPYKYDYETSPTNERFNWVMNHELLHIVASDKAAGSDGFFRGVFAGKVAPTSEEPLSMFYSYLTTPRKYAPRWYHEGAAVFMETWMSGGIGRALGGWDEMVFRAMTRDKAPMYDIVGLESEGTTIDFQVGANSYLYGTRFISYAALKHGPEKVISWISRTDEGSAGFAGRFNEVFGVSLEEEWQNWISWERAFQSSNIDSIRQYPVTRGRRVSASALGSVSRAFFDSSTGLVYAAINYPGQVAHIASINLKTGAMDKLCNVQTPALYYVCSLAFDPDSKTLFYTSSNSKDWRSLWSVDCATGSRRVLLHEARIGDLVFSRSDKVIWGVRHNAGISTIVRIPPPYDSWYTVLSLDYGKDIFDLDVSPDGRYLTGSYAEINGRQSLIRMQVDRLVDGSPEFETLLAFDNNTSPESFTFSRDGRSLYGTSYYTGVSNIMRADPATKQFTVLTNAESGYFRPIQISSDSLLAFEYTGQGFVPTVLPIRPIEDVSAITYLGQNIVDAYPVVRQWKIGSPALINPDSLITSNGPYSSIGSLSLQSIYPVVQGYKDYAAAGVRLNVLDPLQLSDVTASVSFAPSPGVPAAERLHSTLSAEFSSWTVAASYNNADFYDLFGPTKTSRKGYSLSVKYGGYLLYDRPQMLKYTLTAAGYAGLDRLPDYQNIASSFDQFYTLNAKLSYENLRRSLGAVEMEEGVTAQLISYATLVLGNAYPQVVGAVDIGGLLPLDHSSVWLRLAGGNGFGDRGSSFNDLYFGGFGNNWVDHRNEKRYREIFSFPGVELNAIGGSNFGKAAVEWTLPPIRFRHAGFGELYCSWARVALFTGIIGTDLDRTGGARVFDAGAQIDFRLSIFWRLESTLSFGCAAAVERGQRATREFMVSLKIL
jgi:hypothetical protein